MNAAELKRYKHILLALQARLRGDYAYLASAGLDPAGGDLSTLPIHMADMGSDTYEQDFTLSLMASSEEALERIDEALERIEDGTFGQCVECERPIPKPRLEAIPYTPYCVECASKLGS